MRLVVVIFAAALLFHSAAAQQPVGPLTFVEINTPVTGNPKSGWAVFPTQGFTAVYRYIPSASFNPATHQLQATAVTSGTSALVVAEPCLVPGLPFRGAQRRNQNSQRCDLTAGNGGLCTWGFAPCASLDAPYYVSVENRDPGSRNITITVTEVDLTQVTEAIVLNQWVTKTTNRGDNVVFGPVTVAANQMIEAFIIADPSVGGNFGTTLLMDTNVYPVRGGACQALQCGRRLTNFNPSDPCMLSAFSEADCLVNAMTSTAGQWYFRAEDNGNGVLNHTWRFRVRLLTPSSTPVVVGAAAIQPSALAFADTAYFTFPTAGVLTGRFDVRVRALIGTQTGLDAFNVILGNPTQPFSCSNRETDSISMNTGDNQAVTTIDACDANGAAVPFSVTRIRAENESRPLQYTVEVVLNGVGPTPIAASLGQTISGSVNGNDLLYQLPYLAGTAPGSEFVPRVFNMVQAQNAVALGEIEIISMRGTADPNCANNRLRYRCDNVPVSTCTRDDQGGDTYMDMCEWFAQTGDLFVYMNERGVPTNFTFAPTVVLPIAATTGVAISGSLQSGEVKLYALTNSGGFRNFNAWANSTSATQDVLLETFSTRGVNGCKRFEDGCSAGLAGCTTVNFCPDFNEMVYVRLVNNGAGAADFVVVPSFTGTTPSITIGTPYLLTFTTASDQLVKFTTGTTAQAFEVLAVVQPAREASIFVERTSCNFNNPADQGNGGQLSFRMTDPRELAGEWYILVRSGTTAVPLPGNITITVRLAPCATFAALLGNTANSFCNGTVAPTKAIAAWDTFQNMDDAARDAYYLLDAAGTQTGACRSASKSIVCALNFPACGANGFPDNSADCRQDCEAHVASCYNSLCQQSICGGLPLCTTTSTTITPAITGAVPGPDQVGAAALSRSLSLFALVCLLSVALMV